MGIGLILMKDCADADWAAEACRVGDRKRYQRLFSGNRTGHGQRSGGDLVRTKFEANRTGVRGRAVPRQSHRTSPGVACGDQG